MSDHDLPPTEPTPQPPVKSGARGWVRILLFASLALNIAIVGMVVGVISMRSGGQGDGSPRLRDAGLGPIASILTPDQRESVRGHLRAHGPDLRLNREKMRGDIARMLDALRSDPFDAAVFETVLQGQRDTLNLRQEFGHDALIKAIATATPDEREKMAQKLERALKRGEQRRKKK